MHARQPRGRKSAHKTAYFGMREVPHLLPLKDQVVWQGQLWQLDSVKRPLSQREAL